MRRALLLILACLLVLLAGATLGASPAHAGSTDTDEIIVTKTKPENGAELTTAPSEITLTFQNRLPAMTAKVVIQNERNEPIKTAQPVTINNRFGIRVRVTELNGLPAGKYTVTWQISPTAGKAKDGKFSFTLVTQASTETTVAPTTTEKPDETGLGTRTYTNYGGLLGTLGRALGFMGLAALFGALLLIALAWAEGVEYVLTVHFLYVAWGVGVVGNLLTVATAAADAKRPTISIARALVPTQWDDLLQTTFGKAVVIRLAFTAACFWVAHRPERVVDPGTRLMAFLLPVIALVTYGWTNQDVDVQASAIPAGIAHAVAGAAWFGGAALLTRVVLAGPGDADLVGAIKGFRRIYFPAILLVIASGAVQTVIFLGGAENLTKTKFGKIFLLKIVAVAVMAFVATANRDYARQRLARAQHLEARPAERLRRSVRTEVTAGAVVFLLAGWLVGTTPPGLYEDDVSSANKNVYESEDGTFRVEVKFGKTQVNAKVELHFRLIAPETVSDAAVTFEPVSGRSEGIVVPILGLPRYGFGTDRGFQFGSSGAWTIIVTAKGPDGRPLQTVPRQFIVANQDGSPPVSTTTSTVAAPTTRRPTTTSGG